MDELRIRFLGTGNAFHRDGRGSQSIWLEPAGSAPLLVDVGPTAVQAMLRYGETPERVERVLFTHLHGDHIAGWPFLLLRLVLGPTRERPLDVHGPSGLRDRLDRLSRACFDDALRPESFELRFHEWPIEPRVGEELGDGITLDRFPVKHHPSSMGLRLGLGGMQLGVSGDTGWCEGLEQTAAGTEMTVVECTSLAPESETHLSLAEIRRGRERLGSRELVLVHTIDAVAEELAVDPIAGVLAAHDGMLWRPPGAPGTA